MWTIMAFLIIASLILTHKLKTIPTGKQNIAESFVEFINNMARDNIGHHWKTFAPYMGTIFMFLVLSNTASLFNILPEFEITPPTKDINVTAALSILSMSFLIFNGFRIKKFKGFIKSHFQPMFLLGFFIKMLDYFTRSLSLCLRLFGNVLACFIVMEVIYSIPYSYFYPGILSIYFDIFDGILQTYIFVFLTSIYFSEAVE
jgi:F-type H+-transporting ATPase subunit a